MKLSKIFLQGALWCFLLAWLFGNAAAFAAIGIVAMRAGSAMEILYKVALPVALQLAFNGICLFLVASILDVSEEPPPAPQRLTEWMLRRKDD